MAIYFVIQNSSRKPQSTIKAQELGKLPAIFFSALFLSIINNILLEIELTFQSGTCQAQGKQLDIKQATWYDSN